MPRLREEVELGGEPALVERRGRSPRPRRRGPDDQRQRQHAAAADAAEEIGFGLAHRARPIGKRGGVQIARGSEVQCGSEWSRRAAASARRRRRGCATIAARALSGRRDRLPSAMLPHPQPFRRHRRGARRRLRRGGQRSGASTRSGSRAAAMAPAGSPRTALARLGPAARDKAYLGYSDAGYLLAGLYRAGFPDLAHGPMPQDVDARRRRGGGRAGARPG